MKLRAPVIGEGPHSIFPPFLRTAGSRRALSRACLTPQNAGISRKTLGGEFVLTSTVGTDFQGNSMLTVTAREFLLMRRTQNLEIANDLRSQTGSYSKRASERLSKRLYLN